MDISEKTKDQLLEEVDRLNEQLVHLKKSTQTEKSILNRNINGGANNAESGYELILKNMLNGFAYHKIITNKKGQPKDYVFLDVNESFEKLTGLKKKEIIGKTVTEVLPGIESAPENLIERYGEVALKGTAEQFEVYSNPLKMWYSVNAYSPKKGYFVTLIDNIDERKKSENAIKNIATRFSAITGIEFFKKICTHITEALQFDYAFVGELTPKKDEVKIIAGIGKGEEIGSHLYQIKDTPCAELLKQSTCSFTSNVQALFPKDLQLSAMNIEGYLGIAVCNRMGETIGMIVLLNCRPIKNAEFSETFLHIFSERIATEIERIQTEKKIREYDTRYQMLFETGNDILLVHGFKKNGCPNNFIEVNNMTCKMLGYTKEELFKMTLKDITSVEDLKNIPAESTKLLEEGKLLFEKTLVTKTGEYIPVEIHSQILEYFGKPTVFSIARDITERKKADENLRESEKKLIDAQRVARLGHFDLDLKSGSWTSSLELDEIFGIGEDFERNMESLIHIVHTDYKEDVINYFTKKVINQDKTSSKEYQIVNQKTGEKIWVQGIANLKLDESGNPREIFGTIQNISERKRAEQVQETLFEISNMVIKTNNLNELISDVRAELGKIINTTNFHVGVFDVETDRISSLFFANEKVNNHEVANGKTLARLVIEQKKSLVVNTNKLNDLKNNGEVRKSEVDPKIWLGVPMMFEGSVIGVLSLQDYENENTYSNADLKIVEFVSDQISIAIHRRNAEERLMLSEERFKNLSSVTVEGIIIHKKRIIIDANISAARILGYEYDELIGKDAISTLIDESYHSVVGENIKKKYSEQYEVVGIRKDKSRFFAEIEGRDFTFKDGGEEVRVVAFRDITARKKTEKELKEALQKATESDRLKSAFLATMSHELRTPLNAIIGFSEFLSSELTAEEVDKFGEIINNSGNHLLSIVNDLFEISLIESGQIKISFEKVSVNRILSEVHTIISAELQRANKNHLSLEFMLPDFDIELFVNTDSNKLKQILINLLKNAIKFTNEGYINFGCKVLDEDEQSFLKFYVEDSGIGIAEEKHDIIFDTFRQAQESNTRKYGGTGIGLSVAKRLTELLGGEIWLESELDKGSSFFFKIPIEKDDNVKQVLNIQMEEESKMSRKVVLIVEDDIASYEYLNTVLILAEINSLWVKNGKEAIKICKEDDSIDLVLMDINMPVLDGYAATKEIKKFKPNLPIIAQTAYAISGDKEKALQAGCDNYIPKPINREVLLQMMNEHLK